MSSTSIGDAGVGRQVPLTRRSALRAGAVATLAATVAALVPSTPAEATPLASPADVPLIDRAEALLVELAAILPRLSERDVCNVGHNLDIMQRASEGGPERFAAWLATDPLAIGEGHRACDESDRWAARQAFGVVVPAELPRVAAPAPLFVIEQPAESDIRAVLLVLDGEARVWSNTLLGDRAASERWARERLAAGEVFDIWDNDDD